MVVEMGLCHWDDLRSMLRRLLALNAPAHHAAILTAFAEVCAQLAAPSPPPPPPAYGHPRR
uniref:OVATE domain-containing protein n=2 Tax=Oryza brachyantha TaxID=4533 RepID=J3N663_ORYBR